MATSEAHPTSSKLYFGYGSNLWQHQMALRCPSSGYVGVARFPKWRWIINSRGYANVVEGCKSSEPESESASGSIAQSTSISTSTSTSKRHHEVYGLVYDLTSADEARLDVNEGVPEAYTKEMHEIELWACTSSKPSWVDVTKPAQKRKMLVYVDRKRTEAAKPKKEYVHRMNRGIADAEKMGVPAEYVEGVLRGFIPAEREEGEGVEEKALRQAMNFVDENV